MDEIFVVIQKGIQCPFFVRPERAASRFGGMRACPALGRDRGR